MSLRTGFVTIGRNEGERLERCLRAVRAVSDAVVYVDSGSTDGSVAFARSLRVEVVELDPTLPFSMSRGRNAGWRRLLEMHPDLDAIQFLDGDCELIVGWMEAASEFLIAHPDVSVVCGRRRERFPENSLYNRLCDVEWNSPVGEARSCGGDALMRVAPLRDSGGFNEELIAGEEPELCLRIREAGGRIWRIDQDMTWHDANILSLKQWWKRHVRGGYGAVDVATRCADRSEVLFASQVRSARRWVIVSVLLWFASYGFSFVGSYVASMSLKVMILGAWAAQAVRIGLGVRQRCDGDIPLALKYGFMTMLAKWPQSIGQWRYWRDRAEKRPTRLIEYKK